MNKMELEVTQGLALRQSAPYFVSHSPRYNVNEFLKPVEEAKSVIGCSADVVHLVPDRKFIYYIDQFRSASLSSALVAATTMLTWKGNDFWSETFLNADNVLVKRHPECVLAHEFAHVYHYHNGWLAPQVFFRKPCSLEIKEFAAVFLVELEEVLADSLLPEPWRKVKNTLILREILKQREEPHPLFLAFLEATTELSKQDLELLRRLKIITAKSFGGSFPFVKAVATFQHFCSQRRITMEDAKLIENRLNGIIHDVFGIKNAVYVGLKIPAR
jgi:hypothetical protein